MRGLGGIEMIATIANVLSIAVLLFCGLCAAFLCVEEVKMHKLTIKYLGEVKSLCEDIKRATKR